jgi:dienelactone hydrolase
MLPRVLCLLSAGLLMAQSQDPAGTARKALDLLLGEKYADLVQMITPAYRTPNTQSDLTKLGAEIKTWGAVEEIGKPTVQDMGPVNIVVFPVKFATRPIDVQMSVNASGQVSAPLLRPGQVAWQPPSYVKAGSFKERAVIIGDQWKLPGTLTVPAGGGPFPAVVLIHGFGPNDRDETVGGTKMFRDLAEGLASRGIAVLRYEKRTKVYTAKMASTSYTPDDEVIEDAAKAIALLRTQPEVNGNRVFALGHDFGGYLLPRVAAEDGKLAGLIILGASARPLEDLILEQIQAKNLPAVQVTAAKAAVAKIKILEASDDGAPRVFGLPAAYWVQLKGYDAPGAAKKLGIPMLVLQGERDFQTSMTDFNLWKQALAGTKGSTVQSYPSLNHIFVAGEGKSSEEEYRKPAHVAPEVIDVVAKFIG